MSDFIYKIGFEVFARGELFKWRRECKFVDFYKLFYSQDLFFITILASLSELCYKFIGCADLNVKEGSQQIDTLSILDNNKNTLMNVNDCPFDLAKSTFSKIKEEYSNIDMLLVGYQNASPYPQCFENLDTKHKIEIGKKVSAISFLS